MHCVDSWFWGQQKLMLENGFNAQIRPNCLTKLIVLKKPVFRHSPRSPHARQQCRPPSDTHSSSTICFRNSYFNLIVSVTSKLNTQIRIEKVVFSFGYDKFRAIFVDLERASSHRIRISSTFSTTRFAKMERTVGWTTRCT